MSRRNHWTALRQRKISRRTMLGASAKAGVGVAGLALVGCGDDDEPDAGAVAAERAAAAAEEAAAAAVAAGEARAADSEAAAAVAAEAAAAAADAADAAADAADAAGEASAAASQAASAADAAAALAAEAAESEDAANAAAAAEAAAAAAADAAAAASAAGDQAAAAVAAAASEAAEAAAQAARDAAAAVEAGTATAEAAQAAIDEAAEAAAAAAAAAGEASAAAGQAAATAAETAATAAETAATAEAVAEAAAETAAAAVAAAQEAADAAQEAAESAAMAAEDEPAVAAGQPRRGGTMRRSWAENLFSGWDPHTSTTGADALGYIQHVYDRMLGFNDDASVKPMLAESVENPDEVTYIFNMRPNTIFQDGAPVDANAVQLNMERVKEQSDIGGGTRNGQGVARAVNFEPVDDLSWRMVNSEPFGPTLAAFQGFPGTGLLISPEHFDTALTDPVGAGHLKFVSYTEGEDFVGERWDGYWDAENVWLDGQEVSVIQDTNTAYNGFLNGDFDIGRPSGGVTAELKDELEADGFKVITGPAQNWTQTWYNLNPGASEDINYFRDPRLRRAAHLILDRNAINDAAYKGIGVPSEGPTGVESWALTKDYYADSPNLDEAQQLMDAAGFGDGLTGVMLGFGTVRQRLVTEPAHAQWAGSGMNFDFVTGAEPPIIDRLLATQDWSIAALTWESPFDPDPVLRASLEGLQNWMYGSPEGGPRTGRASLDENPNDQVLQGLVETEEQLNAAAAPPTQAERIPLYDTFFQTFQDHGWNHHIVQWPAGFVAQGYVEGFRLVPFFGLPEGGGFKGIWYNNV